MQELFTATYYPSFPAPAQGWQAVQPYGMGFPMQYNAAMVCSVRWIAC